MHHPSSVKYPLCLALWVLVSLPTISVCQILDLRDLRADEIRALDRGRTVVILQGGILEEHGPYLPIYTDGWTSEYLTKQLAEALVARTGWKVLLTFGS